MKRRDVHFRPEGAEALESLRMLSGVGAAMPEVSPRSATFATRATFQGTYSTTSMPDVGTTYRFAGKGDEQDGARASLAGDLRTTGFIQRGHATGTLTLKDAGGTIRLAMTGPDQPGFATLPDQFAFVIKSGTGRYARSKGSGTAQVALFPALGLGSAEQTGAFTIHLSAATRSKG